jgi:leader peptidase (prepilin peptidase)/N-methyltransferase
MLGWLAFVAISVAPGLITGLWVALVTRQLVVIDIRLQRLPNVLVVPGLLAVIVDVGWSVIVLTAFPSAPLLTALLVAAVMLALNLVGGLGMGDVKLSVVIAGCLSLVSPILAIAGLMLAFFLGGAYSAVLLLRHRGQRGSRIAFGPMLLLGFWSVLALSAAGMGSVVSSS